MSRFAFIVLHYKAREATLACVESILALDKGPGDALDIVVVENGCHDSIEGFLAGHLGTAAMGGVTVLVSEENLGFARGNDLGFAYAKRELDPDFFIVCNNDVVFARKDTCKAIAASYAARRFDVMGPDIYNPLLGVHQSPGKARIPVPEEYVLRLEDSFKRRLDESYSGERKLRLKYLLMATAPGRALRSAKLKRSSDGWDRSKEGVELQGSCVVFSRDYAMQMDWAFCPDTFMYLEELISLVVSQIHGFEHVYDPSVQVQHMHGVSTSLDHPDEVEKHRFFLKENLKSVEVLKQLLCNVNGDIYE